MKKGGATRAPPTPGGRRLLPPSGRKAVGHTDAELSALVAGLLGGGRAEGLAPFW